MNKILLTIFCGLILTGTTVSAQTAAVETNSVNAIETIDEIKIENFSEDQPGILPGNPFYFLKEWGRDFRLLIIKDPAKKFEICLTVINEKAAEIKKLEEINLQFNKSIARAISGYQESLEQCEGQFQALKTINNSNISKLVDSVNDKILMHWQFLKNLKLKFK